MPPRGLSVSRAPKGSRYNETVPSRLLVPVLALALITLLSSGCRRTDISNPEAVREAVVKHIEARGDIDLKDLELTVRNVSFQGDTCQAEVSFDPVGQPAGSGMTMRYSLERDGNAWKVKPPQAPTGAVHPPPASAPTGAAQSLPPGHPPLPPAGESAKQP